MKEKMKKFLIIFLIFAAVLASLTTALGVYLAKEDLEKCGERPDQSKIECWPADAIIAVSGGDTEARTNEAIKLYQNGWAKKLIFSGAAADKSGPSNAAVMRLLAIKAGVPSDAILIEETSENTRQNAVNTSSILEKNNIASAILVTSSYHSRRVNLEFSKAAPEISFRSHTASEDKQWSNMWWTTLVGWQLAFSELVKIIGLVAE